MALFDHWLMSLVGSLHLKIMLPERISQPAVLVQVRKERTVCGELRQLSVYAHLSALPSDLGDVFPKLDELILTNNHISRCPDP